MSRLGFENITILWCGVIVAMGLLALCGLSLRKSVPPVRIGMLIVLRATACLLVVFLLARPFWGESSEELQRRDSIALLVDRSASMSLKEGSQSRYAHALSFARDRLFPSVRSAKLKAVSLLFAEDAVTASGRELAEAEPAGRETNLARGIIRAVAESDPPPLAVIALTDGATTMDDDNARAMSLLVENGIPFIGVGFGSESDSQLLSLDRIIAPSVVSPQQEFRVSVELRATGATEIPTFSLVLTKNGKFVAEKSVPATKGPRVWQESFLCTEDREQFHTYRVRLLPPADATVSCPQTDVAATVRVVKERDLQVLFVQGALTWDYKFIRLALQGDPTVSFSGLSRTANGSRFFQSVEESGELVGGFPSNMKEMAPYRVVILSHLKPTDLTTAQQELLAQFCSEYGGGLLMIGGPSTFNAHWKDSQLEQLLPVRFAVLPGRGAQNQTFRLRPTPEALQHPVFQISNTGDVSNAWNLLPVFTHFAAVDSVKPGAQLWLEKSDSLQRSEQIPLMIAQRFGAGITAVICVQNFWRWRLGQEAQTEQFDRFWRQLLRYLAEGDEETINLTVPDQDLRVGNDIRVLVEQKPDAKQVKSATQIVNLQVLDDANTPISTQQLQLQVARPADVVFRVEEPGSYHVRVLDKGGRVRANRSIELRDVSREFARTSRQMESLRQWANLSSGVALRCEECRDTDQLLKEIRVQARQHQTQAGRTVPAGINGWVLALLLACLGGEWTLRKRWSLK